ncbi:hypothetical protein; putative membrane protein [Bradyrhizobium sp. ORS 278]|nr:hypothetical protein; putative membrane protein [Bradyrhizobium sp. ORS 278]
MAGTSAATLIGLMFVGVTLGTNLSIPISRAKKAVNAFMTPTLVHFGGVLFQAMVAWCRGGRGGRARSFSARADCWVWHTRCLSVAMTVVIRIALAAIIILVALLVVNEPRTLLGPRDPIAADGSLKAGRALTISDLDPTSERATPDLDDPGGFEQRFSSSPIERNRDAVLEFARSFGPALCKPDRRQQLIATIQEYYATKRYLSAEFHFRGPRASQFIKAAWTTPKDHEIEDFVQQLLEKGYIRPRQIWLRDHSFLFYVRAQYLSPDACSPS